MVEQLKSLLFWYLVYKILNQIIKGKLLYAYFYKTGVIIILFCSSLCFGQEAGKHAIYLELLGNGGMYSFNYERQLTESYHSRIGISYFSFPFAGKLMTVPLMLNHFNRKSTRTPELGFGIVLGKSRSSEFNSAGDKSGFVTVITANMGYRF